MTSHQVARAVIRLVTAAASTASAARNRSPPWDRTNPAFLTPLTVRDQRAGASSVGQRHAVRATINNRTTSKKLPRG